MRRKAGETSGGNSPRRNALTEASAVWLKSAEGCISAARQASVSATQSANDTPMRRSSRRLSRRRSCGASAKAAKFAPSVGIVLVQLLRARVISGVERAEFVGVNIRRAFIESDAPAAQTHDARKVCERELDVVQGHDERALPAVVCKSHEQRRDRFSERRVERGDGFIG